MGIEYIGVFQIIVGVIGRFWPVWLALAWSLRHLDGNRCSD